MVVASTTPSVPPPLISFRRYPQVLAKVGLACALLVCVVSGLAYALDFPPLIGRVVDQAVSFRYPLAKNSKPNLRILRTSPEYNSLSRP